MWPAPPDEPRVEYIGEIDCAALRLKSGFFGKVKRLISGKSEKESIGLPFDLLVRDRTLFMTCQNVPALVQVNLDDNTYRLHMSDKNPFEYPIALCEADGAILITDSERGIVYRFRDGRIDQFVSDGLDRPTGIAALDGLRRLYVVDTGDHTVKVFDYEGNLVATIGEQAEPPAGLNFPTFATAAGADAVLVNDALNYRIKRFDGDGVLMSMFGEEGDGPGAFSRPKGLAVDSDGHIYVVDNLFDNVQVFDVEGQLLVVVGDGGQNPGQFWSPGGIDIVNDTIYIADTFNNRIQILHYLGDEE
jgi:hypothetical protein